MALANRRALSASAHYIPSGAGLGYTDLCADLFLIFLGKADEMIILGANEKGNGSLVESSPLPVPFLDTVQSALSCQVKHEQYCDRIITDQRQHVDEFSLSTEIPDGERDLGVPD